MADKIPVEAVNTYEQGGRKILAGMLSSPHIRYLVDEFEIIEGFQEECLDSATYHMRIGGKVVTSEDGKIVDFELGEEEDKNKNVRKKFELKPNSLAFVTTIEKFNLPKDIIARYNLKSKWVHKGLLLGTGPIVDPELNARLLIPLHNFSSQPVLLSFNEKLISVEFTKTLNPNDRFTLRSGKISSYVKNRSRIFDFDGYLNRIGGRIAESSVSSKFYEYDKTIETSKKRLRNFSLAGAIAISSVLIALLSLFYASFNLTSDANKYVADAEKTKFEVQNKVDGHDTEFKTLNNHIEELRFAIKSLANEINEIKSKEDIFDKLEPEFKEIKQDIEKIDEKVRKIEQETEKP